MSILFDQIAPQISRPLILQPDPIVEPNSRVIRWLASTPWNAFCVGGIPDAKSGSASSFLPQASVATNWNCGLSRVFDNRFRAGLFRYRDVQA